ncbi:S8 family serine peptidase [Marinobacter halodurans]|uniref:S8 family serine peptidase n=1 Tax=Marinobacter halodurans TaxID=2528979 RepID=UPI001F609642|nr:S8 family serine peptidase [Marinobacter halodurans]
MEFNREKRPVVWQEDQASAVLSYSRRRSIVTVLASALVLTACGGGGGGDSSDSGENLVSGRIGIEARTRIDSDTADDIYWGTAVANDDTPQSLPSPAIAGGYLSASVGTYGGSGTDFYRDMEDDFRLHLSSNQVVSIAAFAVNGASSAGTPSALVSLGSTTTGLSPGTPVSLSPTSGDGNYDLRLQALTGGPFRYLISVSSPASDSALGVSADDVDWVPGEALVTMASPMQAQSLSSGGPLASATREEVGNGLWRVKRNQATALTASTREERKADTLAWIQSLREVSGVVSAEPNYLYHALTVDPTNDSLYPLQEWHYQAINLPTAWQALASPGEGVRVAVLDTGVFSRTPNTGHNWHPDLDDGNENGNNLQILSTSDFVTTSDDSQAGEDGNPANPGTDDGTAPSFHGTHVAGTIAALDNDVGGVGVAPLATLLPIRVLDNTGNGSSLELINAINYLASLSAAQRPDIINLSLGGVAPSTALENAINNASDKGILFVAAAGNQGTTDRVYPAAFDRVIAVGAVDAGNKRASYSTFGNWIDLVAPGGDSTRDGNNDGQADAVYSDWGQQTGSVFEPAYAGVTGTSMAAPHVSGVLALMRERDPSLSLAKFREYLRRGELTDVLGSQTEYGYGLINALKAVDAASADDLGTFISAYPSAFLFDGSVTEASVLLEEVPGDSTENPLGSLTLDSVPSWLSVTKNPDGDAVRLDATIIDSHAAKQSKVTLGYTNENGPQTLELPVNVQLGDPVQSRNAGRHYVLLYNADDPSGDPVQQTVVTPSGGRYTFTFKDVPAGRYLLVAGTDMDNNGLICEQGEACAEYPTNGLPQPISKGEGDLTGLTLTTSFRRAALSSTGLPHSATQVYRVRHPSATTKEMTR